MGAYGQHLPLYDYTVAYRTLEAFVRGKHQEKDPTSRGCPGHFYKLFQATAALKKKKKRRGELVASSRAIMDLFFFCAEAA